MKKVVLTFGLISGVIMSVMMTIQMSFIESIGFDRGEVIGYTSMVLSFLLIYFGVRTYRDDVVGGTISFGRALGVGLLIAFVASLIYVATWEAITSRLHPDFMEKYSAYQVEKARSEGASEASISARKAEMDKMIEMNKNPAINAAFVFLEPMPVGLVVALVTAGVLSRRKKTPIQETALT